MHCQAELGENKFVFDRLFHRQSQMLKNEGMSFMEEITRPHDRFFKETFSQVETARDFVRHYLPKEIAALLNLDTLEVTKDSFVDES